MVPDTDRLLVDIERCIVGHGGDLGGWTRLCDGALQLFDGRVTLHTRIEEKAPSSHGDSVHAHVLCTLHDHDEEVLDACLIGMGETREDALRQVAASWVAGVAGPVKSFIDGKAVCMTRQIKVMSPSDAQGDYGLTGVRGFVGPSFGRGIRDQKVHSAIDHTKPWFQHAVESAAPRRVHLAKAMLVSEGNDRWSRALEVDGHDVAYYDPDWIVGVPCAEAGYITRFAVFEFPHDSKEIARRAELERSIRYFAANLPKYDAVDNLMRDMIYQGFDPDVVHQTESISTIAFGRLYFQGFNIPFCPTVILACRDGRIETDVPLMTFPAYSRAMALAAELQATLPQESFQVLCLHSAESHAILKILEANNGKLDLGGIKLYPCIVPERGASNQTIHAALDRLHEMIESNRPKGKRPWWKVW